MTTINSIETHPVINRNINSAKIPVQKESDTTRTVLIGTGLAALAAAGIYIATRGKSRPKSDIVITTQESKQQLKELTLDAFKLDGKFEKGKAVLNNGENFSGTIITKNKKLEYKDGILQSSVDKSGDKKTLKQYFYDNNGSINKIIKDNNCLFKKKTDGDIMTIVTENRSVQKDIKNNQFVAVGDSRGIYVKSFYYDETTGKLRYVRDFKNNTIDVYGADGKTLEAKIADSKNKCSVYYDENGNVIKEVLLDPNSLNGTFFHYNNSEGGVIIRNRSSIQPGKQSDTIETFDSKLVRYRNNGNTTYSYQKHYENGTSGCSMANEKELWKVIERTEKQDIRELVSLYREAYRAYNQTAEHLTKAKDLCPNRTIDVHFEVS